LIKKILFIHMEGDSFSAGLRFFDKCLESAVATLDEKHGRDVNLSGITFEIEFDESLSEEMLELKL